MFNWPGYKYLGPGNKLNLGEPVNKADYIAQQHDIQYDNAKTHEDIFQADKEAINKFFNNFVENKHFVSGVSSAALYGKHFIEKNLLNKPIYPRNTIGM